MRFKPLRPKTKPIVPLTPAEFRGMVSALTGPASSTSHRNLRRGLVWLVTPVSPAVPRLSGVLPVCSHYTQGRGRFRHERVMASGTKAWFALRGGIGPKLEYATKDASGYKRSRTTSPRRRSFTGC